jgi:uncharacterized protein YqeY
MTLKEQISKDFMTAFKEGESGRERKNFLGVIKGEIQTAEGRGTEPTDENVLSILKKVEKSLKQTNTEESKKELTFIEGYLPQMMSEEDIRKVVMTLVSGGATNIGQIMGQFNKNYKGKADNKIVSQVAKELV